MPIGRDVPEAYWFHRRAPEGQVGCGPVLAVLLIVFFLAAVASASGSATLVLLH